MKFDIAKAIISFIKAVCNGFASKIGGVLWEKVVVENISKFIVVGVMIMLGYVLFPEAVSGVYGNIWSHVSSVFEEDDIKPLRYAESDEKNYPVGPDDFAIFTRSDDPKIKWSYPEKLFEGGVHKKKNDGDIFRTADGSMELCFSKKDAAKYDNVIEYDNVKEKPLKLAEYLFEEDVNSITNFSDSDIHVSDKVSKNGYARTFAHGNSKADPDIAYFICRACTKDAVYTIRFKYYWGGKIDQDKKIPVNYICESLYRGWSISGASDQQIRTYDEYCK